MDQRPLETDASKYSALSPFELKDELIDWARDFTQHKAATHKFLNAGRGNPNWIATTPREAFFLLGQFALEESKRVWDEPDLGGMPHADGIADRLRAFLDGRRAAPGARAARRARSTTASTTLGFDADAFVHELVDAIVGDNYPVPDRMLRARRGDRRSSTSRKRCATAGRPPGKFDLFAVEGGTAAMCYVFESLIENRILKRGDTIALGTPIFTPYLEMPHLDDFGFETVDDRAERDGRRRAPHLAVHRRGDREARGPAGQGVLRRQPVRTRRRSRCARGPCRRSSSSCARSGPISSS